MEQEIVIKVPPALLQEQILLRVRGVLPFLDTQETVDLLGSLYNHFNGEKVWLDSVSGRETSLSRDVQATSLYPELKQRHEELNSLEMERFLKVQSVPTLHASCTEYRDILARRTLELVEAEMDAAGKGLPPLAYALISMGSDGREEQTLITDQDYLIVYADDGGEEADLYFKEFAELLVERLADIGFKKCTGDIMPSNPTWRGSYSQWRKKLLAIVRYEYEDYGKNLMDLIVLSDARYVAGNKELANDLIDLIRGLERDYFSVLWGMAKAATEMKLALGFMKRLWTEGSGEHKGEFNIKLLAWAPLVMNVRILSINQGIPATSTLKRIEHLEKEGSFSRNTASGLSDAYHILTRHRILLQIKVIKGIQRESYYLNPYQLTTDERERIRHALLKIEELQKTIHTNFHIM
ncbi:nucleotidyltransferase [Geobacter pelophilus]|uniref:Nucleotidyltransferase n=1 Tax=Geoanaerobacter pelophilus TaxID=60036 RepID=A0AAW4LA73_9BACT|nr:putative nucleotidyltransferase substrate binding domain-containing protein [Geoanaerobacter pelophilus]MBT0665978.1 nucleotidyltransferase [Geoanaerobacter pelophilus]